MIINIPYYEDNTRISNSNLGWFLKKGPTYLKRMLDGKEEGLKLPQLEKGTMIHEYILQPNEFWKDYVILDFEVPKVKQQKELCDKYHQLLLINPLEDNDKLKLEAYNSAYNNKKTDTQKLTEAQEVLNNYKEYLEYLNKAENKKVISFADLNMLKQIETNLKSHVKANELLFNYDNTFEINNEFHINWEYPNVSKYGDMSCKSLLDRVMIDHTNKKIILIDLKTTTDVFNFKHSMEEYDYYRQLAYYWMAIHWYFKIELGLNIEEYNYETYIIAIQNNNENAIRVFEICPKDIEERFELIDSTIKEIAWHKDNNLWEHTKEYYLNNGVEKLNV